MEFLNNDVCEILKKKQKVQLERTYINQKMIMLRRIFILIVSSTQDFKSVQDLVECKIVIDELLKSKTV